MLVDIVNSRCDVGGRGKDNLGVDELRPMHMPAQQSQARKSRPNGKLRETTSERQLSSTVDAAITASRLAERFVLQHTTYSKRELIDYVERRSPTGDLDGVADYCALKLSGRLNSELEKLKNKPRTAVMRRIVEKTVANTRTRIEEIIGEVFSVAEIRAIERVSKIRFSPLELAKARWVVSAHHHHGDSKTAPNVSSERLRESESMVNSFNYQKRKLKKTLRQSA